MTDSIHAHIWTETPVRAILKTCNDCPESRIVFNQYERPIGKNAPGAKSPDGWRVEDLKLDKPRTRRPRKAYKSRESDLEKLARWAEWQRLYVDEGLTAKQVAERVGARIGQVAYALSRLGTTMRPKGPLTRVPRDSSRDERMLELVRSGKTFTEVGREYGMTRERVRQILKAAGLTRDEIHALILARHPKPEPPTHKHCALCGNDIPVEDWASHRKAGVHRWTRIDHNKALFEAVRDDLLAGMRPTAIVAKHHIFPYVIQRVRFKYGIPKVNKGSWLPTKTEARARKDRIATALRAGATPKNIAAVEGCSDSWVKTIARERGIAIQR